MADITNLFKATVKTVRIREKALGTAVPGIEKSILPTSDKVRSDFTVLAREVVQSICTLRDFLLEHRKDYLNTVGQLSGEPSTMTDRDRDQIDSDAKTYIKTCSDAIQQLKIQAHSHKVLPQVKEHKDAVLELVSAFLTGVCQLYSEQQAVRVKRVVDRKRLSRLETVSTKTSDEAASKSSVENAQQADTNKASVTANGLLTEFGADHEPISEDEEKLLQLENQQLFDEMSSMVDEVRQIEGKIIEIARLQEIFADKVLEQDRDINKINETVVGTTENIKEGNEQIRGAMKNNAAFRIMILFFLIVCTFSLLFLDWYNP